MPDTLEKLSGVVPVLYYDLIARIIPGTSFLMAATWYDRPALPDLGSGATFFLWLGAGYLAGLLLTGLGLALDVVWWCITSVPRLRKFAPHAVTDAIDDISRKDAFAGHVLFKMLAEAVACSNTLVAYVLLWILSTEIPTTVLEDVAIEPKCWLLAILILAFSYRTVGVCYRTDKWRNCFEERE